MHVPYFDLLAVSPVLSLHVAARSPGYQRALCMCARFIPRMNLNQPSTQVNRHQSRNWTSTASHKHRLLKHPTSLMLQAPHHPNTPNQTLATSSHMHLPGTKAMLTLLTMSRTQTQTQMGAYMTTATTTAMTTAMAMTTATIIQHSINLQAQRPKMHYRALPAVTEAALSNMKCGISLRAGGRWTKTTSSMKVIRISLCSHLHCIATHGSLQTQILAGSSTNI